MFPAMLLSLLGLEELARLRAGSGPCGGRSPHSECWQA